MILATTNAIEVWGTQSREFLSPDGEVRAILDLPWTATLEDVRSGKKIATLYGDNPFRPGFSQRGCSIVLAFSPNGKLIATKRCDGPIMLWHARTGRLLATLGPAGDGASLEFSADSRLILFVARIGLDKRPPMNTISVWDVTTQEKVFHVRAGRKTEFNEVMLSPDGKTVMALVGPQPGTIPGFSNSKYITDTIRVWDIERGGELLTLKGPSARFSSDGRHVIVRDSAGESRWRIKAGTLHSHSGSASARRARRFCADNVAESAGDDRWKWTVFIKSDGRNIDEIECIRYRLHPSFPRPVHLVCSPGNPLYPFGLSATGWGTFSISIRVFMKDGSHEDMNHQLRF